MTRLKFERLMRAWSLQTLGYHTGIQGTEISKIERRLTVPYPSQVQRLCAALTLEPHTLLEEVSEAAPPRVLASPVGAASLASRTGIQGPEVPHAQE